MTVSSYTRRFTGAQLNKNIFHRKILGSTQMATTISFEDITPGASVRFTEINGKNYVSVRDLIMSMCMKNSYHSTNIWKNIRNAHEKELQADGSITTHRFPGPVFCIILSCVSS